MKTDEGLQVWLHALDGRESSDSRPCILVSEGVARDNSCVGGSVGPSACLDLVEK
jgi:hypothetical protein